MIRHMSVHTNTELYLFNKKGKPLRNEYIYIYIYIYIFSGAGDVCVKLRSCCCNCSCSVLQQLAKPLKLLTEKSIQCLAFVEIQIHSLMSFTGIFA